MLEIVMNRRDGQAETSRKSRKIKWNLLSLGERERETLNLIIREVTTFKNNSLAVKFFSMYYTPEKWSLKCIQGPGITGKACI